MNVYFHTFGCKANQYDTELVRQAFTDRGAVAVDDPAAADLAIVNSCTVTHESEAKLRRFVGRLARHYPRLGTVVMGCAAARDDGAIAALPAVRAVVGGADPAQVLRAAGLTSPPDPLSALRRGGTADGQSFPLSTPRGGTADSQSFPLSTRRGGTADSQSFPLSTQWRGGQGVRSRGWLKIQDGCDEHCTFCATTIARGANRSRSIPELVQEAQALAQHHAEIVLTGVHIGTYGQDRAADPGRKPGVDTRPETSGWGDPRAGARGQSTLGDLLEALIQAVPQVRFRLSSIEATEVDDTIARLLIEAPRNLAAHLHAPLQAGSDRVLKRMGRHWYTAASYRSRIEWLAERLPVFGLGADIIAGFPGETDADHGATLALVAALPFTYLHVFPFSARPDTAATRLGAPLPPRVVRERARELRALGEAKARAHRGRRLGQRADGVVSGRGEGKLEVLTEDYLSVYLPIADWNGRPRFDIMVR